MNDAGIPNGNLIIHVPAETWAKGGLNLTRVAAAITGNGFTQCVTLTPAEPAPQTVKLPQAGAYAIEFQAFAGERRVVQSQATLDLEPDQEIHLYLLVAAPMKGDEFEPLPTSFTGRLRAKTRLRFDLPTEAQWEYACRAGTTSSYHNGKDCTVADTVDTLRDPNLDDVAWYGPDWPGEESKIGTREVGLKPPNAWGLYDMHGNVWEMCLDYYADYPDEAIDPLGPPMGMKRTGRGGSWHTWAALCRSGNRMPAKAGRMAGMRLACPAQDITPANQFMIVDVSAGPEAGAYPVSYSETAPTDLLTNADYKTGKIVLRRIPAGKFIMGTPETEVGRDNDEKLHPVTLTQDFYIGVFQVTQGQWKRVTGQNPSFYQNSEMLPIENISWETDMRGGNWPPK